VGIIILVQKTPMPSVLQSPLPSLSRYEMIFSVGATTLAHNETRVTN
jgi:hypothetical protein